jgi:Mg2+/Co2+ transporter CorB
MSGLVVDLLGYVPDNDTNPTVTYEGNEIQVLKVEDNWIAKVRLKIMRNS